MKVTNEEKNEKIATKAKGILGSKPLIAICAVIIAGNLAYPSISKLVTAKEENKVEEYRLYLKEIKEALDNNPTFIKLLGATNIKKSDFKKWFFEVVAKMPDKDLRLLQNDYYNNITKI